MGKLCISIKDDTEEQIRRAVLMEFGGKKGSISTFIESIIREYFNTGMKKGTIVARDELGNIVQVSLKI